VNQEKQDQLDLKEHRDHVVRLGLEGQLVHLDNQAMLGLLDLQAQEVREDQQDQQD